MFGRPTPTKQTCWPSNARAAATIIISDLLNVGSALIRAPRDRHAVRALRRRRIGASGARGVGRRPRKSPSRSGHDRPRPDPGRRASERSPRARPSLDVLDGRVDALAEPARHLDHPIGAVRRTADAEARVAAGEDPLRDRVEQLMERLALDALALRLLDQWQREPFPEDWQVAAPVQLERDPRHRLDVPGDPDWVAVRAGAVRSGDEDHQGLAHRYVP